MDRDETREGNGNLDHTVVGLGGAAEDLVWSHEDRLKFRELSVLWEVGGGDLNLVSNLVQRRGMASLVGLLCHFNTAVNELSLDRIPKSIGYHVRSERGSRDNNSFFKLGSKTDTESVRGDSARSIDPRINSNLYKRNCSQPVQSLL